MNRKAATALALLLGAVAITAGAIFSYWPATRHFGLRPADRAERDAFVATLRGRTLTEAAPHLVEGDDGDESPVLLYRALDEAYFAKQHEPFRVENQAIGDCVSWGSKHAVDIHGAVLWRIGAIADWKPASSEAIYGGARVEARGIRFAGYSDGATGYDAAKWLKQWGVIHRQKYGDLDLTHYSGARAKEWGAYGCGGKNDNGNLDELARAFPVRDVAPVTTYAEAVAALKSGYPIIVCSYQGFEGARRDQDGFARPNGRWAHCMCFIGCRFDREGLLCLNSWGPDWIKGPKWPPDQPDGSFWIEKKTAEYMLQGGGFSNSDSYAVSGLDGFPWQKIDHEKWVELPPVRGPPAGELNEE